MKIIVLLINAYLKKTTFEIEEARKMAQIALDKFKKGEYSLVSDGCTNAGKWMVHTGKHGK